MNQPDQLETRVSNVMEDPSAQALARTYATAFLNAAETVGVEGVLEEFVSFMNDVLGRHPDLESILLSGIVPDSQKVDLIARVLSGRASELFNSFLRVLAKHGRLELLQLILEESQRLHEQRSGRGRVTLTAARALSDAARDAIYSSLNAALPFDPVLETRTDPSLLGGLVIRIGDTVYDSSVRTRLKQLRARLRERNLHEIQGRRDRFSHPEGD
jgi:F-type H+-transporting ATPase subunit delta